MKKSKINGKFNLNKETVIELYDEQLKDVKGGLPNNETVSFTKNCSQEQAGCKGSENIGMAGGMDSSMMDN